MRQGQEAPQHLWGMENAFTEPFKRLKPVSRFEQTGKLGRQKILPCHDCEGKGICENVFCLSCLGQGVLLTRAEYDYLLTVGNRVDDDILSQQEFGQGEGLICRYSRTTVLLTAFYQKCSEYRPARTRPLED